MGETLTMDTRESKVRSYSRAFPAVFHKALGATLWDESGRAYLDFLAGAGSLNYGHNNPRIIARMTEYIQNQGIIQGLDMMTRAKREFIEAFDHIILKPRQMNYKIQFPGPTGTNAVEAAIKLARKVTGRFNVIAFTNGYHGMTAGALAATGNVYHRRDYVGYSGGITFMPFDGYFGPDVNTIAYIRRFIEDSSSGLDTPAAVILETVQGEGGVNVAAAPWLQALQALCQEHGILLIVDDIQAGCGRTGEFFSFSESGIEPDIVTLSKSLSACGLPMSIVLIKPGYDVWEPGEHNGTFRGNNLAFVAATEALKQYWSSTAFTSQIESKARFLRSRLDAIAGRYSHLNVAVRGRGLMAGLSIDDHPELARSISAAAFHEGLILETCGNQDHVVKFLPPLIIESDELARGLDMVETAFAKAVKTHSDAANSAADLTGDTLHDCAQA